MAELTGVRANIFSEETIRNASASEAVAQKLGQSINFINNYQYTEKTWNLNENAALFSTLTGIDGIYIAPYNITILKIEIYGNQWGSSGSTTFDLHRLTGGNTDAGTLFVTKPNVLASAVNDSYSSYCFDSDGTVNVGDSLITTGFNTPELTTVELDQFDAIRFDPDTVVGGCKNLSFQIIVRPR